MEDKIPVLVTLHFTDEQLERLRAVSPRLAIRHAALRDEHDDITPVLKGDEEIIYAGTPPRDLAKTPRLKWVQLHSAGINHLRDHPILKSEIKVTSASGIHAVPIGEFTLALMLALARRLPRIVRLQERAEWPKHKWDLLLGGELRGKTIGILGYGSIGREVARMSRDGFRMRVFAMQHGAASGRERYNEPEVGDPEGKIPQRWFGREELPELLASSDFVVLALPLTRDTRFMVGEKELRAMRPESFLINIARGELVDERALVRALKENWIAGAGLDAYGEEPLPRDSALWRLENAIIAPHISGATPLYDERAVNLFSENLRRYLNGTPLLNLVDKEQGY